MAGNRIALDVMGGDAAPRATVLGALRAVQDASGGLTPERLLLVGDADQITAELERAGGDPGFEVSHATQVVAMTDSPAAALRSKPDSSIARSVLAVREGAAGAVVSMGNTGACVAAATRGLGTLEGIRRPGIAVTLDLTGHPLTIVDMGANIAPKPDDLYQYGVMGAVYAQDCLGVASPRVGLLNIGQEEGKGTDLLKAALPLFKASPLRFVGNVEGGDMFGDVADVVVTDGFTGNVVLKLLEDFSAFMLQLVMKELRAHSADWGGEALAKVRKSIDYAEYGGAILLGVGGVVVIGHGRSDAAAVANALTVAARFLDAGVNEDIVRGVRGAFSTRGGAE